MMMRRREVEERNVAAVERRWVIVVIIRPAGPDWQYLLSSKELGNIPANGDREAYGTCFEP